MRPIDADELIYEIVNTPLAEGFPYDKEWFDRLQSNIHKIIDMVENAPTVNEWISIKERLPEMGQTVVCAVYGTDLIVQEDGETFVDALRRNQKHAHIELGYLAEDGWNEWDGYPMMVSPSYWMPFPDIPMPEVGE